MLTESINLKYINSLLLIKRKKYIFAARFYLLKTNEKNYVKSVRNRFHCNSRFV